MQKASRRPMDDAKAPTEKRPLRHLARFILLGIYSGTRAGAIASASPIPAVGRSFVDLERGRYYRRPQGSAKTNKRQPTVAVPLRLLAHLRRWHRINPEARHFVEFNGKPVSSVKDGVQERRPARRARSRHIAAYVAAHGRDLADAARHRPLAGGRLFGNVAGRLLNTYGHHHSDYLSDAVEKIAMRASDDERKGHVSGAISGAVTSLPRKIS
jgi:integrase